MTDPNNPLTAEDVLKYGNGLYENIGLMMTSLRQLAYVHGVIQCADNLSALTEDYRYGRTDDWPQQPPQKLDVPTLVWVIGFLRTLATTAGKNVVMVDILDATPDGNVKPRGTTEH